MKYSSVVLCALLFAAGASSQVHQTAAVSHPLGAAAPSSLLTYRTSAGADTLRVLALMVAFKEDSDPKTAGNGLFDLNPASNPMIDPPPYDRSYFVNKLAFLSNYFRKVSDGKLIIAGAMFDSIVTLPNVMSAYSPAKTSTSNRPLANLVADSWRRADSLMTGFDFSRYDAFVIFHAGAGRDVDMLGILGFDPTPNDIPSLTLNLAALRTALDNPSYSGVPVRGGAFRITNSIILPSTESRIVTSGGTADTIQLSMNGLLCASIGSYLGLPDLFDTKTGKTGIGQFGLMDGASFFAFSGLFPPEPSAWEKIRLGWVTPVDVTARTQTLTVPAVSLTTTADTIYRIAISPSEYFLIENRSRDPLGNGQTITVVRNGTVSQVRVKGDTAGFSPSDLHFINGSVIDVEDFDWALPGYTGDNVQYHGGGILIWHIDEAIIDRTIAANAVNADPAMRGVDLEEADGSQDIGREYSMLEGGYGTEYGASFDCWYAENPAPVYKNLFDATTTPNSCSNSRAATQIRLKNFSNRGSRMTVTVERGGSAVAPLNLLTRRFSRGLPENPIVITGFGAVAACNDSLYVFSSTGASRLANPSGFLGTGAGTKGTAVSMQSSVDWRMCTVKDSTVYLRRLLECTAGVFDSISVQTISVNGLITTAPVMGSIGDVPYCIVGGEKAGNGILTFIRLADGTGFSVTAAAGAIGGMAYLKAGNGISDMLFFTAGPSLNMLPLTATTASNPQITSAPLALNGVPWRVAAGRSHLKITVLAWQNAGTLVAAYDGSTLNKTYERSFAGSGVNGIALGDLKNDGTIEAVLTSGASLYALNAVGVPVDGFPVRLIDNKTFTGNPLIFSFSVLADPEIAATTSEGELVICTASGMLSSGSPYSFLSPGSAVLSAGRWSTTTVLAGYDAEGALCAVECPLASPTAPQYWTGVAASQSNASATVSTAEGSTAAGELLPPARTYNYPNPVYGKTTQFRFYTTTAARVTIRIFDVSGVKVAELSGTAAAACDNELTWDVTHIQSGVYLARVEADASSFKDYAIIKVVVVK